jgi:hypothetical protein
MLESTGLFASKVERHPGRSHKKSSLNQKIIFDESESFAKAALQSINKRRMYRPFRECLVRPGQARRST